MSSNIFDASQITQHKWAWPFLDPVDYKGLGLDDYLKVMPFLHFDAFLMAQAIDTIYA